MATDSKYGKVTVENDSENHPLNDSDEPVFVLRAQDQSARSVLRAYILSNPLLAIEISRVDAAFAMWQNENISKLKVAD